MPNLQVAQFLKIANFTVFLYIYYDGAKTQ